MSPVIQGISQCAHVYQKLRYYLTECFVLQNLRGILTWASQLCFKCRRRECFIDENEEIKTD